MLKICICGTEGVASGGGERAERAEMMTMEAVVEEYERRMGELRRVIEGAGAGAGGGG